MGIWNFICLLDNVIQVKHLRQNFLWNLTILTVNYFCKKLHFKCLTGFWIHLWIMVFSTSTGNYWPTRSSILTLREKCPNTEFFLVLIFPHSDWIRRYPYSVRMREDTDEKKLVFGHISHNVRDRLQISLVLLSEFKRIN